MDQQAQRFPDRILLFSAFLMVSTCLMIGLIGQSGKQDNRNKTLTTNETDDFKANVTDNTNHTVLKHPPLVKRVIQQPSCPKSYMVEILQKLCVEVHFNKTVCVPGDEKKQKIKESIKVVEGDTTIHLYVAGALFLVSICIVMDLMDFKSNGKQTKAPLSRKCSLADLTVLKHQRKELIRRESILESPEESSYNQMGRMVSRPPLRID